MSDLTTLPSLNALRAFAAIGRHLNLVAAAAELHVTPSALSHQIRTLEERLGTRLFEREARGLALTEAGRTILPGVRDGFATLAQSLRLLDPAPDDNTLHVSMLSTFAMRWFIPRLVRFQQAQPQIEVRIATSISLIDFEHGDFDCAIRSGSGQWQGLTAERLFAETFTPVCSPRLATPEAPLAEPADLAQHTLLHAKLRPDDWRIWLHAAGEPELAPKSERTFETRNFAIQAAIDGLGVAIIDPSLVTEELHSGRLVQPFARTLASDNAYYLVFPRQPKLPRKLQLFRDWLLSEARET